MRRRSNEAVNKDSMFRSQFDKAKFLLITMVKSFAAKSPPISADSIPGPVISLFPVSKASQARSQMRKEPETSLFAISY